MITAYMLASRDNILFVFKPTDLCICLLCILFFSLAPAQQCKAVSNQNSSLSQDLESDQLPSAEVLWNQARESLDRGDIEKAADTFLGLYRHYPDAPMAEESLWRAAVYYRDVASASRNPDWEAVRLLFKMYAADFSESPRVGEAYFEMGIAQFHKRFYREALTRFKLFLKRFPDSPLASKARYFQAKCLVETGQLQEAKKIFEEFVHNDDTETRAKGLAGVAEVLSAQGKYLESLPYFRKSMALSNTFYLQFPEIEILRVLGETYLHLNNEEYGRKHLLHYLNIAGGALDRAKVLSQLAESYMREGNSAVAQRMYDKVIEEGRPGDSAVVLAKFRKAQFLDDPHSTLTKWQKKGDLLDPSEDAPYLNLLDIMYKGDVAQEARWGLFVRYRARDDFAKAELTGRHYLQYAPSDTDAKEIRQKVDAILLYITEKLIDKKDYQAVYDLYLEEHPHVVKFSTGRLLYLVGRALEELYLFDQAAVVYYRAVKLPLSEADKIDLYYRRAHVYLVIGDLNSADILLKYIRQVYEGRKEVGEIYSYSGKLAEAQGDTGTALDYYEKAFEIQTFPEKKYDYARDYIRLLLAKGQTDMVEPILDQLREEARLSPEELQLWYEQLGDAYRNSERYARAEEMYLAALDPKLPQDGKNVQRIKLYLGDVYRALDNEEKARQYYAEVRNGKDQTLQRLAAERLKQEEIEKELSRILPTNQ